MKRIVNNIIGALGAAMIAYYFMLGFGVRFGQSLMFLWPLVGALCIGRWLWWRKDRPYNRTVVRVLRILFALALVFFFTVEGIIFAGGIRETQPGLDYIVVLGAKVNGTEPSGALRNRIAAAGDYLEANPGTVAVLSGGQGADEGISEAECMHRKLTERGITEERLIMEDRATDTEENLAFSRALINDDSASVGIVTNDFHMYRAMRLAKGQGWSNVVGISVPTTWISWPHYMMREFVGVVYDTVRGNLG